MLNGAPVVLCGLQRLTVDFFTVKIREKQNKKKEKKKVELVTAFFVFKSKSKVLNKRFSILTTLGLRLIV